MIKVRKVLCYFSGLVLTLAGIPFITEFIFESLGGQQVQYMTIYPIIGGILIGFGILVCCLAYRSGNKAEIIPPSK
jgi:inner membrane protein involved in colicin E2 resistance